MKRRLIILRLDAGGTITIPLDHRSPSLPEKSGLGRFIHSPYSGRLEWHPEDGGTEPLIDPGMA